MMTIQTERLVLRRFCAEDLQDLYEYLTDEETVRYEPYKPMDMGETEKELAERIASDEMIAVVRKSDNKLIGNLYLGKREFETVKSREYVDWKNAARALAHQKSVEVFGMKTLYVSDLDGTLLRSNETTSEYTNNVINSLTDRGMIFSYATARSLITAKKATKGINAKIPLIVYNGTFVIDNVTEKILIANYFDKFVYELLDELFSNKIYPIVYAYIEGKEKFSFVPELCTRGMKKFLNTRKGDIRTNIVNTTDDLRLGDIFYIVCVDEPEKLKPLCDKYQDRYHCVYHKDIYTNEQWLEIMPQGATKSNAIRQLQSLLGCEKVVVFGDGKNDIDMFQLADEGYAVENAHEDLKKYATAIIPSNDDDGVAKWFEHMLYET